MIRNLALLLVFTIFISTSNLFAADQPLTLSIGAVKTNLEKDAIRLLVDYTKNLHEVFLAGTADLKPKGSPTYDYIFALTPDVHIETGGKDTFESIVAKAKGNLLIFELDKLPEDPSIVVVKSNSFFHVIPFSVGIEADRQFTYFNTIVESGYIRPEDSSRVSHPKKWQELQIRLLQDCS